MFVPVGTEIHVTTVYILRLFSRAPADTLTDHLTCFGLQTIPYGTLRTHKVWMDKPGDVTKTRR